LLQQVSNLIDVANVQDDLLQRLKDDTRLDPDAKARAVEEVDGPIMEVSTVCNPTFTPTLVSNLSPTPRVHD
jgi:nuclear pore complex protein Nup155